MLRDFDVWHIIDELWQNNDVDVDEENEEFVIEMHENVANTARLQARYTGQNHFFRP